MARILFVEDSPINRHIVRRILRDKGHDVDVAEDGPEGLAAAKKSGYDLILLDLDLPTLSGWDVARTLKGESKTARVPILALTAHAMNGDRERALNAGCDDYATKPVQVPDLLERIEALLKGTDAKAA